MEPVLTEKDQFPTQEIIYSHIGKSKKLWNEVFEYIHSDNPELIPEWRYYNDGKSWLMKVTKKAKTIFWLSVIKEGFRTTFYFTDKAEQIIIKSTISAELKENFLDGKKFGKIRGVTIIFKNKKNIEDFKSLLNIKLSMK